MFSYLSLLPVVGNRLVVDCVPVLFTSFTIVQVVAQDVVFLFRLLPLKQHRGVCVSDGQDGVWWSWNSWWDLS